MPTYTTLPETADVIKDKTQGYKIITISDDVDVGYWWSKTGGSASGKLKVTLKKPNNTLVVKTADTGEVQFMNSNPQKIKVLILPSDVSEAGNMTLLPEFKIDDSWIQADLVTVKIEVNPLS